MILRNALASTKPVVTIEVNGQQIKITAKIMVKTIIQEFTLDKPCTYDPGSGTPDTFINSLQAQFKNVFLHSMKSLHMPLFKPKTSDFRMYWTLVINDSLSTF